MVGCLLCLEISLDLASSLKVESKQWQELNVQNLIEKHFWTMEALLAPDSLLCCNCWQELYTFHKFYTRIEEAHADLVSLVKKDKSSGVTQNDIKPYIENITFNETHFISEIPIEKALIDESFKQADFVKKEEHNEEFLIDETVSQSKNAINDNQPIPEDPLCKKRNSRISKAEYSKNQRHSSAATSIQNPNTCKVKDNLLLLKDELNNGGSSSDSDYEPDKDISDKNEKKHYSRAYKAGKHANDKFLIENFKINCSLCEIQTETFHQLCKHFKTEHNSNGYVICCRKKFYRRSLLVDHVHQHVNPNYFKCTICDKVMADRKCLNMHNKTHNDKKDKIHPCDICNKKFSMYMSLKLHKMSHLPDDEKHVPCAECNKKFATKTLLSNHVRSVHQKKYINICDICGKSIRCKEVFERHMLQHEGKPLPTVSCDVCGLLLANKHSLKQHKIMVHPEGGKKEFTCSVCGKNSPNLKAHKKHVQYNHERGYDHKCAMCEKAFKTAYTLTEHMASHTGNVLYTCPWCPKTFNSNANFHSHRKKSHRKEWEEVTRKKYSGNLPPNYNPPPANNSTDETPAYM